MVRDRVRVSVRVRRTVWGAVEDGNGPVAIGVDQKSKLQI